MRKHSSITLLCLALLAGFVFLQAKASFATVGNRIVGAIATSSRVPLRANVSPLAMQAKDLGPAAANTRLPWITLSFQMTPAQQSALSQLLLEQQEPGSPMYHQWLTPEQFAAQFGVSPHDSAAVASWLTQQGFTINAISRGGQWISFAGTAAQVRQAFGTEIHTVQLNGETHLANLTAPSIPSALASMVSSIQGLHDFRPRPRNIVRRVSPEYTSSTSGNHYLAPGDFYTIYDVNPLLSSGINGTGITIAVMGQVDLNLSDVATFRTASGLPANVPTVKLYGTDPGAPSFKAGAPTTGDVDEAQLDVEWAGAVAPNASILFVNSTAAFTSLTNAIDNNLAPIISISYGDCETNFGSSINSYNQLLEQAAAQGQTVVAPSGDSGATDCDGGTNAQGSPIATATNGLAVDFPASSPYVTGVGGTTLTEGSVNYWNTANGANSGSAKSYIPETVWDDTSSTNGLSASGGGVSVAFAKPTWQTGTGVPNDYSRDVPDVALAASPNHDGYLICSENYNTGPLSIVDAGPSCQNGYRTSGSGALTVVGGTSASTPSFAGILALVMQKTGAKLGNADPVIYALANGNHYNNVFHDVTVGSNSSPCTMGSIGCPSGGSIGYGAGIGYDLATGWGSVDAFNLANLWTSVSVTNLGAQLPSTTTVTASPVSSTQGATITFTAAVAPASGTGTPTGTVQFLVNGSEVGAPVPLSNGTAVFATSSVPAGDQTVTAFYSGDSTYGTSKADASITVISATNPDFSISPLSGTLTAASPGQSTAAFPLTFTSTNGLAGTLTLTVNSSVNEYNPSFSNATFNAAANTWSLPIAANGTATAALTIGTVHPLIVQGSSTSSRLAVPDRGLPGKRRGLGGLGGTIAGGGMALAALWMIALPRRRRLWTPLLAFALLAALGFSAGCGNNAGGARLAPNPGTSTGSFPVVVTATISSGSTTITHSTNLTLVVQ